MMELIDHNSFTLCLLFIIIIIIILLLLEY